MTFIVSQRQLDQSSLKARHKVALKLLQKAMGGHFASLHDYRYVEALLELPSIDLVDEKKVKDRLYLHRQQAGLELSEAGLSIDVLKQDQDSSIPFLDVHIVLNQLRSAFNVGSILRTTEAMRLGSLYFEGITPKKDNQKVIKTAMGCHDKVPCFDLNSTTHLPRPIIGLETTKNACSIYEFKFPKTFTLILFGAFYRFSWLNLLLTLCSFRSN